MTFRIDSVQRLPEGGWAWSIKGIGGHGIYGCLETGRQGNGLYQVGWDGSGRTLTLLLPDFTVNTATPSEAVATLAAALLSLGWGPRLDNR